MWVLFLKRKNYLGDYRSLCSHTNYAFSMLIYCDIFLICVFILHMLLLSFASIVLQFILIHCYVSFEMIIFPFLINKFRINIKLRGHTISIILCGHFPLVFLIDMFSVVSEVRILSRLFGHKLISTCLNNNTQACWEPQLIRGKLSQSSSLPSLIR